MSTIVSMFNMTNISVCFLLTKLTGIPRWFSGKESACQCRRRGFEPWVRKTSWRRKWQPTAVFLPGESHGQRSLGGYSPWGHKRVGHDWATKQQIKFTTFCLTVYVFMMHSEIACHFMSQSRGQSISGQPHAPEEWRMGFCRHSYGVTCGISMWYWILKWLFSSRTAQQTWLFTQEWLDVLEISL